MTQNGRATKSTKMADFRMPTTWNQRKTHIHQSKSEIYILTGVVRDLVVTRYDTCNWEMLVVFCHIIKINVYQILVWSVYSKDT